MNRPPFEINPPDLRLEEPAPALASESAAELSGRPGPRHLVVVRCREATAEDRAPDHALMVTRFWHPRDHRWSGNYFESLEHALRLFVDETGWILIQQQQLDAPEAYELIFEARRDDFTGPTTEEILRDVGLDPG